VCYEVVRGWWSCRVVVIGLLTCAVRGVAGSVSLVVSVFLIGERSLFMAAEV